MGETDERGESPGESGGVTPGDGNPTVFRTPRRTWWVIIVASVAVIAALATAWALQTAQPTASVPFPTPIPTPTESQTPTPVASPTSAPTGFPANLASYDLTALPPVTVFTVLSALPVDDQPFGSFTGEQAISLGAGAPVFADPAGEPVAYLPREFAFDGTTVPVVEKQDHWVHVLLTGRQAVPSLGNPAQVTGWLRMQDVELAPATVVVEVSLSSRTIDIVRDGVPERIAVDFGWGTGATPTPAGRAFIMTERAVPEFTYTRGHPIVYLSVQSPTLDGFGGADVAVTAFHYHDQRSGAISNGCIRVDSSAIEQLALLPLGTPVIVRP